MHLSFKLKDEDAVNVQTQMRIPLLELDLLRTLVAIAETGNFSAAAAEVGRTPSAVSMQVKRIEDLLERQFFVRDSRSVRLTTDGEALLEHSRRALALNRDIVSRFVDPGLTGEVRLGVPDDVAERFLPEMLRRMADTYPGVSMVVIVDGTDRLTEQVQEGRLDLSVVTAEAGFKSAERAEVIHREPLVWAMLKGGAAIEQDPLPVAVWEEGCVWREVGLAGLDKQGRAYEIMFESAHISGQRAGILADLIIASIPISALGGRIVEVGARHGLPTLPAYALGLVLAPNVSPPVHAAAEHLRACFAKR